MEKSNRLRHYWSLILGSIGLAADMITILGTISVGRIMPAVSNVVLVTPALETILLLTALVGFYSLTLIVWFLFRWRRSRQEIKTFGFDELWEGFGSGSDNWVDHIVFILSPILGMLPSFSIPSARIIFWLATFIALLPTTLWLYLLSAQLWVGCGVGLLTSLLLGQYATYFALVLDKFFDSDQL
jgi:hypothetical protein